MSNTDSFIEEVNEEVRREKLYGYVRRYAWIALVLVLSVVGTTGFLEYRKASIASSAQKLGDRLVTAIGTDEPSERALKLAEITPEAGRATVILEMRRAGELVNAGDTAGAIAVFESLANGDADPIYADMARLKLWMLRGGSGNPVERALALTELAAPGALYRPLALEQQGLAALTAGEEGKAVEIFSDLSQDSEITDGVRNRAMQMLLALGAEIPDASSLFLK
ncbi:MAG: hypothetical protein CML33_05365 [Rhodobacteraceae bacterium]|nr:hypothetical protein [Paracoccaceae bacterium]